MNAVECGLLLPNSSPHAGGVSIAEILALARRAEAAGFESLWAGDHLVWPIPNLDVFSVLTAVALTTPRVRVGPCVLLLPLRHPLLVAQMVQTLDIISGGRVIVGIGTGGEREEEFETLGVPVRERGSRTTEAVHVLRRLWTEPRVTHHGRHFRLVDVPLEPKPSQRPHPPIWVGGRSAGARQRAARLGEGWIPAFVTPDMYREGWDDLATRAAAAGRAPGKITRALLAFVSAAPSRARAREATVAHMEGFYRIPFGRFARFVVFGTPGECLDRLLAFREVGVEHVVFILASPNPGASLDICAEHLLPDLRHP